MILSNRVSLCFLTGEWQKENLYGEFLSLLGSGQVIEVTGIMKTVLFFTCKFSKNMAIKEVLYQIPGSFLIKNVIFLTNLVVCLWEKL